MLTPRHLRNAPIVEALVDLRVKLPPETDVTQLDSIHKAISDKYPKREERKSWESRFGVSHGKPLEPRHEYKGVDGYRYVSEDGKQVIQVRLDGFTFSRLKPYQTWEHLREEAFRHWQKYLDVAHPVLISRVALRYINRLEIKLPIKDFAEYLTAPPIVPESLPQGVASFLTRVVVPNEPIGGAIIIQSLEAVEDDIIPIILDIDVMKLQEFDVDGLDAWEAIDRLHTFKNEVFFSSITEKTMELYQ
jgi:uncharacterized protein (TIGR04255 family)